MKFFSKDFDAKAMTLYPLGDWHLGSRQCDIPFIERVIKEIADNPDAYWCGMGDLMENAIVGSKSDVYLQNIPPKEQMDLIVKMLDPIKDKGLFLIAGNHEQRTMRQVGIVPEQYISVCLKIPYLDYSCLAKFSLKKAHWPHDFTCYFHHNYGGGYTNGGKVNRADCLRKICPTADAAFSGHFHVTSRIPVTWFEAGVQSVIRRTGYDYVTGSALRWDSSYAEEKAKPASTVEFIKVTFAGSTSGNGDYRCQTYEIIPGDNRCNNETTI